MDLEHFEIVERPAAAPPLAASLTDVYHAHHSPVTLLLYLALVSGLAVTLFDKLDGTMVTVWWAVVCVIGLASLWQQHDYGADPERVRNVERWTRRFIILSACNGTALGLCALLFYDPRLEAGAMVPLVFAVIFTVAASHAKTAIPACSYLTFLPALGLGIVAVALRPGHGSGFLMVFLATMAMFGIGFTRSSHRALRDMLQLSRANAGLMDDLRTARDQAESASQAKSAFLAVVSHEVRTPLNAMMGMTELLAEAPLDDSHRRRLDTLRSAGDHILGLIEDMLDFSRIEAGKVELVTSPFHIGVLAAETVELLREEALRKGIDLELEMDDGGWPYRLGDKRRLRQVLVNLLHNAIKYSGIGVVRLRVEAGRDSVVRCRVDDQGPGIPPDRREAVFEPFLRGHGDGGKPAREGAGLGLAICRRLVGLMGGALWLEPLEHGCRFVFTATLPATERPQAPPEGTKPALVFQGRVLVADDSVFGRDVAAAMAAGSGVAVELAEDGCQAVEKAASQRYDLILMDQRMPGLDGPAALVAIRADEARRGVAPVPVVAMTAGIPGKSVSDFLADGFADHLAKPFSAADLMALFARHLPALPATAAGGPATASQEATAAVAACRADLPQLAAAAARDDRSGIGYFAHRIKGIGMLAGLPAIVRTAEALEVAAADDTTPLGPLLDALEQSLAAEGRRPGRQRNARRPEGPIRTLLVDDHEMVRDGLRAALAGQTDFEVVGEAADGLDCIRMVARHHPDLVLIDLVMPRMNGGEAIPEIRKRLPAARIVVLTGAVSPALLRAATDSGADALIRKDVSTDELLRTLRSVMVGRPPPVPVPVPAGEPPVALTRRERQVLQMIVEGRRTRDIADLLALSERTVEKHRASLGHKLGTSTPAEMAALAVRHGLTAEG